MKSTIALLSALLLLASVQDVPAQPVAQPHNIWQNRAQVGRWKRVRTVHLLTGTDNGGEMRLFRAGGDRMVSVLIGVSNSVVETDYVFRRQKLAQIEITRTFFNLGRDGFDFTKPRRIENGRYALRDGKVPSRVTRERDIGGRWKYGAAPRDKLNAAREIEDARFYIGVAASGRKEVDVEKRIKG